MSTQSVQQHPASVDAYIRHGWKLVPIPPGTKGPRAFGWNKPDQNLTSQADLPAGWGIGLAHAWSSTMALDIDNWEEAVQLLAEGGVDLAAYYAAPDAVIIDSGRENRGKLLFQMPEGYALATKKIVGAQGAIYELRCATSANLTVQDVLPPTIHPDTKQPYRWAGLGHWTRLPMIPAPLLALWEKMITQEKQHNIPVSNTIDASWSEIRQALEHIDPSCGYQEWITAGMALHWAGTHTGATDQALILWNEWSQGSDKYPGERAIFSHWTSFKPDKANSVKLGTLFHTAKRHGWTRPTPDVSGMFQAVESKTPVTMLHSWRPAMPDMDLSLWPRTLALRAEQVAESVGCDPLVPLFAGLGAICGVVDARIRLELMPGFKVPPILWLMTLGEPADKKSPGSRPMMSILKTLEMEDHPRHKKVLMEWEGKEAAYAAAKKEFLTWSASPEALLDSQAPMVPDLPPAPVALKITVSDITSQKLVRSASERPRGLLCYLDEMNTWVRKMTDRNGGEDRSAWVVSYESERYEMDRVGAGSIHCENLAVSVYGNIQPTVFYGSLSSLAADGLLQRFIPGVLNPEHTKRGEPIPASQSNQEQWENMVRLIYSMPVQTYRLSFPAFMAFREFQTWYEEAKRRERLVRSSDVFMTAFGKLEGTTGRLILLFHLMESPFSPEVSLEVVERVIGVIKGYVIPAYRYSFGEAQGMSTFDRWVTDYIIQYADETTVTLSQVKRSARRPLENANASGWEADQVILNSMFVLEKANWVKRMDDGSQEHRGVAQWAINPAIIEEFKEYRQAVIKAKQHMVDTIYERQPVRTPKRNAHGSDQYELG